MSAAPHAGVQFAVALLGAVRHGPPVDVHSRGAACEDVRLDERIAHYLQSSSADTDTVTTVDAELVRDGPLWRLDLRVPADGSVRTFRAASCATVIDAAAFVVAVAVDPTVADVIDGPELSSATDETSPPPPDAPDAGAVPVPSVAATGGAPVSSQGPAGRGEPDATADRESAAGDVASRPREATSPRGRARAPAITLGASGGVQGGSLPRVGGLVRAQVGLLGPRWRADVHGQVRTPSRQRAQADRDVGARIGAWSIGARGCGVLGVRVPGLHVPLCGGVEAGQVFAEGFGFAGARPARLPWAAITVGPALTWAVRPALALSVTAEVGVSLLGGALVIDGLETVHRVGPVFGRGLVGLEGRFRGRSGA